MEALAMNPVYPALVMGWAALGNGIDVTIFFTFWGMDMINKATMEDLRFTPLGNPAMHMPPGMGKLSEKHMPQGMGGLPGMTGMATKMLKKQIADLDGGPRVEGPLGPFGGGIANTNVIEMAGDIYAMFNDRPETRAVMDFFSRGESIKAWLAAGGAIGRGCGPLVLGTAGSEPNDLKKSGTL